MSSKSTSTVCDVIGCQNQPVRHYLDASGPRPFSFRVCPRHFEKLRDGDKPVVVDARLDSERLIDGRPGLLLE